jgi:hypothetical protein
MKNRSFGKVLANAPEPPPVPPLPPGKYLGMIIENPIVLEDRIVFPIALYEAVDQDPEFQLALERATSQKLLTQIKVYYKVRDAYQLKVFLREHLGIEAATPGEALLYVRDKKLVVILAHYMGRAYVKATARMEE